MSVVQKISTTHPCHSGDARHTRMCSLSHNRSLAHSLAIGCVFGNRPLARPLQIGHQHGKTLSSEIVQDVTPAMHTLGSTPGERVRAHVLLVLCTSARPLACVMLTLAFACFCMGIIGSASRDNNQRRQTFGQWLTMVTTPTTRGARSRPRPHVVHGHGHGHTWCTVTTTTTRGARSRPRPHVVHGHGHGHTWCTVTTTTTRGARSG
jgi:hypothetical protein